MLVLRPEDRRGGSGPVRLGNHPEVGLCINCVRFLGRRARDYQASVLRNRLRITARHFTLLVRAMEVR